VQFESSVYNYYTYIVVGLDPAQYPGTTNQINFTWDGVSYPDQGLTVYLPVGEPDGITGVTEGQTGVFHQVMPADVTTFSPTLDPDSYYMFGNAAGAGYWPMPELSTLQTGLDHILSLFQNQANYVAEADHASRKWIIIGEINHYEGQPVRLSSITFS
jgi:hypothetical protein